MNCKHCGGPLVLTEITCSYCKTPFKNNEEFTFAERADVWLNSYTEQLNKLKEKDEYSTYYGTARRTCI